MAEDSSEIVKEQSESVAATNLKSLGDAPAFYQNMGYANAVSHQQSMNLIGQAITSKAAEMIINTNPSEGAADAAGAQILSKLAQTTPPSTTG